MNKRKEKIMSITSNITILMGLLSSSLIGVAGGQRSSDADFIKAVTAGDTARIRSMLSQDPQLVHATDADGASAILKAVYHNRRESLALLLGTGVSLDIFEASAVGETARVKELITKEPGLVNAYASDGFYPLGLATFFGHREIVSLLLDSGARVDMAARNKMRVTALHAAAAAHELELARMLIDHGADVNARQEEDLTPLHEAALTGQIEFCRLLLDRGADINLQSAKGKSALRFAIEGDQTNVANLLRSRGSVQ
jgi:ankyrin repeat protein